MLPLVYRVKPAQNIGFWASGQLFWPKVELWENCNRLRGFFSGLLLDVDWQASLKEHVGIDAKRTQNARDQSEEQGWSIDEG